MTCPPYRTTQLDVLVEHDIVTHENARRALAALRIGFGVTFLWAFFDKLLALGYATGNNRETGAVDRFGPDAWINERQPDPRVPEVRCLRGQLVPRLLHQHRRRRMDQLALHGGLAGIGFALLFGVGIRIAAISGALLYLLMWAASFPLENNPVLDDHLLGAISVIVLAVTLAGDTWGFGKAWANTNIVRRFPVLR